MCPNVRAKQDSSFDQQKAINSKMMCYYYTPGGVGVCTGLGHTVTLGIISQTGRHLSGVDPAEGREISFIQMDTAINPGSSGGPLISLTGACVGVNTAGYVEANGISFAVPTAQVKDFLYEVLKGEQPTP